MPNRFVLQIDTDNDAFAEDARPELPSLLRAIADRIAEDELEPGRIHFLADINGNTVGFYVHKNKE